MVRSFEERPIDPAIVERLLANAQRAPSAGFSQGWAFLALEGADARRYWDTLWPQARRSEFGWPDMFNAPLLIVCLSHKQAYLDRYAMADKGWTDKDEKRCLARHAIDYTAFLILAEGPRTGLTHAQ